MQTEPHDTESIRALHALRYRDVLHGTDRIRRALATVDAILLAERVINPGPMLWQVREDLRLGLAEVGE